MKKTLAVLVVACMATTALAAVPHVTNPMDAQINIGRTTAQSPAGDAMYDPFGGDPMVFLDDGPGTEGFRRQFLLPGGGSGNWFYGYLDFYLAGMTDSYIDITALPLLSFDARYFQDPASNTNPYGDAPIFVRMYTYDDDGSGTYPTYVGHRDYSIVYATQPPWSDPQNDWSHVVFNNRSIADGGLGSDSGAFDPTRVSRVRFYGTDWAGQGGDWVDIKNFALTPEPGTLALLALGGVAVLRRRR